MSLLTRRVGTLLDRAVSPAAGTLSGGTVTYPGDGYRYHTFTSNGTLTVADGDVVCDLLIVGGGGGCSNGKTGTWYGLGGGAGDVTELTSETLSPGSYSVTIGAGGAFGAADADGVDGGTSSVTGVTGATAAGGSGAHGSSTPTGPGPSPSFGVGTPNGSAAGGGGGAGGAGGNAPNATTGGAGGVGVTAFDGVTYGKGGRSHGSGSTDGTAGSQKGDGGGSYSQNGFDGVVVARVAVTTYEDVLLDMGPSRYWRLGESSGTTATDETGNGNGTYVGGPTLGVAGAIANDDDTCPTFHDADYVTCGDVGIAEAAFSVTAWFKRPNIAASTARVIYGEANSADGTHILMCYLDAAGAGAGEVRFWIQNGSGGTSTAFSTPAAYDDDQWHFAVFTFDGTTMRTYVDGTERATQSRTTAYPSVNTSIIASDPRSSPVSTYYWGNGEDGELDEVALFTRALSSTEVTDLYNAGT